MKNIKNILLYTLSFTIVFWSCDTEDELRVERVEETNPLDPIENVTGSPGSANFANYIALGNSLTAGFMDGALYTDGQNNSFPNILARQLQIEGVGGGSFEQPDINSVNGFNSTFSDPANGVIAGKTVLDLSIPGPVPTFPGDLIGPYDGATNELNNFGVPGASTGSLLNPFYGHPDLGNPYFARFASTPGASTILEDALSTAPTFFTLWIGSNDVLGYALSGGVGPDPLDTYSQAEFLNDYGTITTSLVTAGAQGIAINLPPVLLIPYFRAVPSSPVPLSEAQATALNAGFAGFNAALDGIVANLGHPADDAARRKVTYSSDIANPLLIVDENLEDLGPKFDILLAVGAINAAQREALRPLQQARPTTGADLVPLATAPAIGNDLNPAAPGTALLGISVPMGDQYILTPEEQVAIVTARATYSGTIEAIVAQTPGLELLDIQPLFADIAGLSGTQAAQLALTPAAQAAADGTLGAVYDGFSYAPDFSPNGIFSTDGVHPNPKGHAIVANELVKTLNAKFGANIPEIDVLPYRTVITAQ